MPLFRFNQISNPLIIFQNHWIQYPGATLITEHKDILAYCHVPKVGSSLWMTTFADMNIIPVGETKRMLKSKSLHDHMWSTFSINVTNSEDIATLSNLYKFVIVRHPFERLVSAFHDKFITTKPSYQNKCMQTISQTYYSLLLQHMIPYLKCIGILRVEH